ALAPAGGSPAATDAASVPAPADAASATPSPNKTPGEWQITVDAINLHEMELNVQDAATTLNTKLAGIDITVESIQFPQPVTQPINLWLTMDNPGDGGWIRAKGPLMLSPLGLTLNVQAGHLGLAQ